MTLHRFAVLSIGLLVASPALAQEEPLPGGVPEEQTAPPEEQVAPTPPAQPAEIEEPEEPERPETREVPDALFVRRAHQHAGPAIVTIRCGARTGTGFVFGAGDVVASTDAWDHCRRGVEVILPDGRVVEVEQGRVSGDDGVALLRLPVDSGAAPLAARGRPVQVGDRLLVVDRAPHHGRAVWVTEGIVASEPGDRIHTDIRDDDVHAGAAVLDERGRVVGVARRSHRSDRVRVVPVDRLTALDGAQETTLGYPLALGLGIFAAAVFDHDEANEDRGVTLMGFGVGLRLTLFDRLALVGSYTYLRDTSNIFSTGAVEREAVRHQADARIGWRFLPFSGIRAYVVPSIGAAARWTNWTDRRLQVSLADPGCDLSGGTACELETRVVETDDDVFSITPYVHLGLQLGWVELGYALALALDAPGTLVHELSITGWLGGG